MKQYLRIGAFLFIPLSIFSQQQPIAYFPNGPTQKIITAVKTAQQSLDKVSYTLERRDTLVTGDVRTMKGNALMQKDKNDSLFGFLFRAKKEGDPGETVYDGHLGYVTNASEKNYSLINKPSYLPTLLHNFGGQMVVPDLVKLDTSRAIAIRSSQDADCYYLTLLYPDLTEYDVIKRTKIIAIDKRTNLPLSVRMHQETLRKIQDLYYQMKDIQVNDPSLQYDFSYPPFLHEYKQKPDQAYRPKVIPTGKQAPYFMLQTLNGVSVSTKDFAGKVALLDFWEVWCGPCIESLPKVQHLNTAYKDQGLIVFGIVNDTRQLESARLLVKKKGLAFQTLIGNEQVKKDYEIEAIPLYILINKEGKIAFVSTGFSEEIESAVKKALAQ